MAAQLGRSRPGWALEALTTLADPATLASLDTAVGYLDALASAYPDLAAPGPLAGARDGCRGDARAGSQRTRRRTRHRRSTRRRSRPLLADGAAPAGELRGGRHGLRGRPDDLFLPARRPASDATTAWLLGTRRSADGSRLAPDRGHDRRAVQPGGVRHGATAPGCRSRGRRGRRGGDGPRVPIAAATVSGPTAESADVQAVIGEDFRRVGAITVLGILVVLALLLRSLVAPLYLVGTVLLSYATTLGLATILVPGRPGPSRRGLLHPADRVRAAGRARLRLQHLPDEPDPGGERRAPTCAPASPSRPRVPGTVITSAGIILAGTFLALVVAPLQILVQVGLAVAIGVLIDTFVVRSLLIPALTALIGERAWWPSRRRGALSELNRADRLRIRTPPVVRGAYAATVMGLPRDLRRDFMRKVMRPLVRSYGDSSMRTRSPGRIRMKFLRSLPPR